MDHIKGLYLIALLCKSDNMHQTDLEKKFADTIKNNRDYQLLLQELNQSIFIGREGLRLKTELEENLELILVEIDRLIDLNDQLEQKKMTLLSESNRSRKRLESAGFFSNDFKIVHASDKEMFSKFYYQYSNAIVYHLIGRYGVEWIKGISLGDDDNFISLIEFVNETLKKTIKASNEWFKSPAWRITEWQHTGLNFFQYKGFQISYYADLNSAFEDGSSKEIMEVSPNLFMITNDKGHQEFVGDGNIMGFKVMDTLSALKIGLVTGMRDHKMDSFEYKTTNPMKYLRDLYGTDNYCISPEAFLRTLDTWALNKTIESRKTSKMCLVCGRVLNNGLIACPSHLTVRG